MSFTATALSGIRVLLKFSSVMTDNSGLVLASNYTIYDSYGPITVSSVKKQSSSNPTSVVLTLSEALQSSTNYTVRVTGPVDHLSNPVTPAENHFSWIARADFAEAPLDQFQHKNGTGLTGIEALSIQDGVYFSPALEQAASNSTLEVDEVDVCTTAYDVYKFPEFVDPRVLSTYAKGAAPTNVIGGETVLWARWARLEETRRDMSQRVTDVLGSTTTPSAQLTLQSVDFEKIALLNNPAWKTFDNLGTPPYYFICANNLSPLFSGPAIQRTYTTGVTGVRIDVSSIDRVTSGDDVSLRARHYLLLDAGIIADSVISSMEISNLISDTQILSDLVQAGRARDLPVNDSVVVAETLITNKEFGRKPLDTLVSADSVVIT